MCTVTWIQEADRYSLFCNRDELRTRPAARPPENRRAGEVDFLAPIDGQAGGTWIAVNSHGLSLCLLNDYRSAVPDPTPDFTSRGLLVTHLIDASDRGALEELWSQVDYQRYRPFKVLGLSLHEAPCLFGWNGSVPSLDWGSVTPPLCSSSFDDSGATRARTTLLGEFSATTDSDPRKRQLRFHQSHLPERGPYSVCMHRPDAVTVSFTLVEVDAESVSMAYADGAPCCSSLEHLAILDRVG